jgi:predicted HicB family RNase H-like nuclease
VKKRRTPEPEEIETKRMNLNVPIDLHNAFKTATAAQGTSMTDVLLEFIEEYVRERYPKGLKRGRA